MKKIFLVVILTLAMMLAVSGCSKAGSGSQGSQGEKGEVGLQGPQGFQGEKGLKGDKGQKGDTGSAGKDGVGAGSGQELIFVQSSKTFSEQKADSFTGTKICKDAGYISCLYAEFGDGYDSFSSVDGTCAGNAQWISGNWNFHGSCESLVSQAIACKKPGSSVNSGSSTNDWRGARQISSVVCVK
ncbi:collagen-like protein [Candidatus Woesearchaeota archaeon]|nr:collagen-like protein [Candidatus Woesearchaeota archaeon]